MHLVQVAKKPTQRGKIRQLEHQLFWSSPEPLALTREPWHHIAAEGRRSSAGPASRPIHPPQAACRVTPAFAPSPGLLRSGWSDPSFVQYFCIKTKLTEINLVALISAVEMKKKK